MANGLPVFVKGIQDPDDALAAIAAGADGIWVSNHGGAAGVQSVYEHLAEELKIVMQLTGSHTVSELQRAKIIDAKF